MRYIKEFEKFNFLDRLLYSKGANNQKLVKDRIFEFAKEVFKNSDIEPLVPMKNPNKGKGNYHRIAFNHKSGGGAVGFIDIKEDGKKWIQVWCSFIDDYPELTNFMQYLRNDLVKNSHFSATTIEYRLYFEDIENFLNELTMDKYELYCDMKNYNL